MAKIAANYDSETGELSLSIDGVQLNDLQSISFDSMYDGSFYAYLTTRKETINQCTHTTMRYSKENKDPQITDASALSAEINGLLNGK